MATKKKRYVTWDPAIANETPYERLVRLADIERAADHACRDAMITCTQVVHGVHPLRRNVYSVRIIEPGEVLIERKAERSSLDNFDKWEPDSDIVSIDERCDMPVFVLQSLVDQLIGSGVIKGSK